MYQTKRLSWLPIEDAWTAFDNGWRGYGRTKDESVNNLLMMDGYQAFLKRTQARRDEQIIRRLDGKRRFGYTGEQRMTRLFADTTSKDLKEQQSGAGMFLSISFCILIPIAGFFWFVWEPLGKGLMFVALFTKIIPIREKLSALALRVSKKCTNPALFLLSRGNIKQQSIIL